ncbi:MAG: hypothetical protein NXH95_11455 [Pseudomonadaceae bacterium]|nr:hypothetical protein [Pseudomonadaceae bacterium]
MKVFLDGDLMAVRLDETWRNAALWPADAESYLAHLKETGKAVTSDAIDHIANVNLYTSSARDNLSDLRSRRADAFAALCENPCKETAVSVYQLLVAHRDCGPDVLKQIEAERGLQQTVESFLLYVILHTPHKVALRNAIILFAEIGTSIDAEVLHTLYLDEFLAPHLFPLQKKTDLTVAEQIDLIRSLASEECFDAQAFLFEHLNDSSPDELRSYLLRCAQFAIEPSFETYTSFDVAYNPEYHEAILEFAKRTRMAQELGATSVDDELTTAALSLFADLSACWLEDVPWSAFEKIIPATEMLCNLLRHLQSRPLRLDDLEHLAFIFDALFSDPLLWIEEDQDKEISSDLLIATQDEHVEIAKTISDLLSNQPHQRLLGQALSSMANPDFDQALRITLLISNREPFDVVFPYLRRALPHQANVRISYSALTVCFKEAAHNTAKAQVLADWCADYCGFENSGAYYAGVGYEFILSNALRMVKLHPGVGRRLVQIGLDPNSPARKLAAEVLNAWPVRCWPTNSLWRIDSAIEEEKKVLALLGAARQKLQGNNSE